MKAEKNYKQNALTKITRIFGDLMQYDFKSFEDKFKANNLNIQDKKALVLKFSGMPISDDKLKIVKHIINSSKQKIKFFEPKNYNAVEDTPLKEAEKLNDVELVR